MPLTLHFHPLASFCWKALIGLYELEIPFEKHVVDLSSDTARADLVRLWPIGKFPVLRDHAQERTVPESTIILEYIDRLRPEGPRLIPTAPDRALECRLRDRFYDTYIHLSVQKIVGDRLRPEGKRDALGVEQARAQMETAYAVADDQLRAGPWAMGDDFTLADCAAFPALFYGNKVAPFAKRWSNITAYFERLKGRSSVERVLARRGCLRVPSSWRAAAACRAIWAASAPARVEGLLRRMTKNFFLVHHSRVMVAFIHGRAAIASLPGLPPKRRGMRLREARRLMRVVGDKQLLWTAPLVSILEAAVAQAMSRPDQVESALRAAAYGDRQ